MKSMASMLGVLTVPTLQVLAATHVVTPGDSLWKIAKNNHLSVQTLKSANPTLRSTKLKVGTTVQIPEKYTVSYGDTLWTVAQSHNRSLQAMLNANPNVNPANLQPGQSILIPVKSAVQSTLMPVSSATKSSSVTNTSVAWLAKLIEAEAANQSTTAKIAVGDVVWHRVQSSNYPNSVKGVIFQVVSGHYQFTPVENGHIYNSPSHSSLSAAKAVLQQSVDYVPTAFVFFTPSKTPSGSWVWNQPRVATIDQFIFAK